MSATEPVAYRLAFLADRTASLLYGMIGYWRNLVVRLSLCLSVCLWRCASQAWCTGLNVVL